MKKPITPTMHGLIDYGLAAGNLVLPRLLKLPTASKGVFAAFAAVQGGLTAVTAQTPSVKPAVPFRLHGLIEKSSIPVFVIAPLLAHVQRNRRGLIYWIASGVALVAVYNLTDWNAGTPSK